MIDFERGERVLVSSDGPYDETWYVLDVVDSWPDGVIIYSADEEDVRFVPTWKVRRV